MNTVKTNYLFLSWSVSRGRDTYGYNICRLDDRETDRRYKCMGGGYDMVGTVIGEWLTDVYQGRLQSIQGERKDCGYATKGWARIDGFYGLTFKPTGEAIIDGACGKESVISLAEAIGLSITSNYNKHKNCTDGFFVTDFSSYENLKASEE